jgi:hypothetical protein
MGYAGNAALVGTPTAEMIASNTNDNAVSQSKSFTYLIPNIVNGAADGTYGLVTETHQILAPITVFPGTTVLTAIPGLPALPVAFPDVGVITIEFAGEWVLRSTATGKMGGATVEYAPAGSPDPTTKVITVLLDGAELPIPGGSAITFQDISGQGRPRS